MARNVYTESPRDTIAAPATPPGTGAIAIVRVSGPQSLGIAANVFNRNLAHADEGKLHLVYTVDPRDGKRVDQSLAVVWRSPKSYTGEDMLEIHCHGSPAVVGAVLEACLAAGARHAQPGEFTRRAFLNGKLDLAQAEAVADLSRSQTEAARRAALDQLGGGLSHALLSIRTDLVQVTAELEASVDYPDEDIPQVSLNRLASMVDSASARLDDLLATYRRGRRLREGARVVFAGPPNAGKSSLFNAILRRERAIVTPHAGTTRDSLEATVDLNGIPLTLVDTAGLRADPEEIEAIGIQRTRQEMESADLVLFVVDASVPTREAEMEYESIRMLPHLLLFNKADLVNAVSIRDELSQRFTGRGEVAEYFLSVTKKEGIGLVEEALIQFLIGKESEGGSAAVVTSSRHEGALKRALSSLSTVSEGLASHLSPEFIVVDLATALSEIDTILGRGGLDEDILDVIFSTFCLGK